MTSEFRQSLCIQPRSPAFDAEPVTSCPCGVPGYASEPLHVRSTCAHPRVGGCSILTAEAGQMNYNGAVGAFGADAILATRRLEVRGSYQRFGVIGGCMGGPCRFRDVVIREIGIGLPFRRSAHPLSGWVVGAGIGLSRERLDINRVALSAHLTRTWRPSSLLALRVEGRLRRLKSPPGGESFPSATLRLGVGLVL